MPKIIAVAGKGGVGKTTLCGMLVRYLVEEVRDGAVLAVDADANANLNELLGVEVTGTIGEAREMMKKDVPVGMTKDVWFEMKVHEAIIEGKGFDLLVMGRPEGPGCYCAANTLAKQSIETLKDNYSYVVVDNEAGMEHISRLVTQDIDRLFVVSDATPRSLLTAKRITELIGELNLNVGKVGIIINRLRNDKDDRLNRMAGESGAELAGMIRSDAVLAEEDVEGKSIFSLDKESVALKDAYDIFSRSLR